MPDGPPGAVGRHVILVGLPGAGKTTVGKRLARRLGWPFLDLDAELVRRDGRPIARQFAEDGEPAFRAREAALSAEIAERTPDAGAMVISPGGGWLENAAASAPLRRVGVLVYLRVPPAVALARIGPEGRARRPLLAGDDPLAALEALFARRRAGYETADHVVDVSALAPPQAAVAVIRALGLPDRPTR